MPRRPKVSEELVASLQFRVDLRCCLCEYVDDGLPRRTTKGQIHHLDRNRGNNAIANLVWLCLEHHEEAGTTGRASRRLSRKTIVRFRDELERRVAKMRRGRGMRMRKGRRTFLEALDAGIVLDVNKLRCRGHDEWDEVERHLLRVGCYPDIMGYEARRAILEYLDHLALRTRLRMPATVSSMISQIVIGTLPLAFLRSETSRRTSLEDIELLTLAAQVGASLAYDGALKLGSLRTAEEGCDILWRVLSYAVIHRHRGLRTAAETAFETALDGARRSGMPAAVTLVTVTRRHGEGGGTRLPEYPDSLALAL